MAGTSMTDVMNNAGRASVGLGVGQGLMSGVFCGTIAGQS
jgi:hypothetical protein